ncbi:MAG: hypothetical protein ACFE0I_15260 [Elainellaceae cyanobacterium]
MMLSFIVLLASFALALIVVLNFKRSQSLNSRQYQVIESLKEKDKHDLQLSRELNLRVKDVHHILHRMEKQGLVRSYWGGLVLITRRGLRYRFYALARKSNSVQNAPLDKTPVNLTRR